MFEIRIVPIFYSNFFYFTSITFASSSLFQSPLVLVSPERDPLCLPRSSRQSLIFSSHFPFLFCVWSSHHYEFRFHLLFLLRLFVFHLLLICSSSVVSFQSLTSFYISSLFFRFKFTSSLVSLLFFSLFLVFQPPPRKLPPPSLSPPITHSPHPAFPSCQPIRSRPLRPCSACSASPLHQSRPALRPPPANHRRRSADPIWASKRERKIHFTARFL